MFAAIVDDVCVAFAGAAEVFDIPDAVWHELPEDFDADAQGVVVREGAIVVVDHDVAMAALHAHELRIMAYLRSTADVITQDFSLLPLRKPSPLYRRGRKTRAEYLNDSGEVVVRKTFSDLNGPDGGLSALLVHFEWFRHDDTVGIDKTQIVKEYTAAEAETEMRHRRERQLDYLIAGAKGTPIAPLFEQVTAGFADEIVEYKSSGSSVLRDAVYARKGDVLAQILDTRIGGTDVAPYTIRDAILSELS